MSIRMERLKATILMGLSVIALSVVGCGDDAETATAPEVIGEESAEEAGEEGAEAVEEGGEVAEEEGGEATEEEGGEATEEEGGEATEEEGGEVAEEEGGEVAEEEGGEVAEEEGGEVAEEEGGEVAEEEGGEVAEEEGGEVAEEEGGEVAEEEGGEVAEEEGGEVAEEEGGEATEEEGGEATEEEGGEATEEEGGEVAEEEGGEATEEEGGEVAEEEGGEATEEEGGEVAEEEGGEATEEEGGEVAEEVAGCQDPTADNYVAEATVDGDPCVYAVTFTVDTSCSGLDTTGGVFLNGTFNEWCGNCWEMEDVGDGIFQMTESFAPSTIEYKFTIGTQWETLDACGDCTISLNNGEFVNRVLTTPAEPTTLPAVAYGSCNACGEEICEVSEEEGGSSENGIVFSGTFGGTVADGNTYTFPSTGTESWAGFANEDTSIYPFAFPAGGTITFDGTADAPVELFFKFEKAAFPDVDPSFTTVSVTVAEGTASYTVDIPAQDPALTYSSLLLYLVTQDTAVTLENVAVTVN